MHATLLAVPLFKFGFVGDDASMLFLFFDFGKILGLCIGVLLGPYSRSGVNHVYSSSIFSGTPLCYLRCTGSVQFVVFVPSLINVTVEK